MVVDRACLQVALAHPERLLDLPQLVVRADHVVRVGLGQVRDLTLPASQRFGFGFPVTVGPPEPRRATTLPTTCTEFGTDHPRNSDMWGWLGLMLAGVPFGRGG